MTARAIILENRGTISRMRELNVRAGRDVFPIPTRETLAASLRQMLGAVARLADVRNPEVLRLPSLSEAEVAKILRTAPDTVLVCGREVAVEYRAPYYGTQYPPRVRIEFRGAEAKDWLKLPEGGVKLPDGREVALYSAIDGYGYYVESPSSQFKAKARECLNQGLWDAWSKPAITVPDPSAEFPALEVQEYGRCAVTDEGLAAFGVLSHDSWYGTWKAVWYRDRSEAETRHTEGSAKWLETREQAARDALKKRVGELHSAHYYNGELSQELRTRMYNTYYGYSGGVTTVAEITAFIAEVEVAVAAIEGRKAETERVKREAEARRESVESAIGDLLDGGYADGHVWVPEDGDVAYILAGKTSQIGNTIIQPSAGDAVYDGPWCFGDSKYRKWVPFTYGVRAKAQEFSGRGNVQGEVALYLREGVLKPGVYGVASDGEGQFFYPVIHHAGDGTEVVPKVSAVRKCRSPKQAASVAKGTGKPASADSLAALAAKFGR